MTETLIKADSRLLRSEDEGLVLEKGDGASFSPKSRRHRKITPPPWAKICFAGLSSPELESDTGKTRINNPFKRKMFRSLVGSGSRNLLSDVSDPTNSVRNLINLMTHFDQETPPSPSQEKNLPFNVIMEGAPGSKRPGRCTVNRGKSHGTRFAEQGSASTDPLKEVCENFKGFSLEKRLSGSSKTDSGKLKSSPSSGNLKSSHRKGKCKRISSSNKFPRCNSRPKLKNFELLFEDSTPMKSQRFWKPVLPQTGSCGTPCVSRFVESIGISNVPFSPIPTLDVLTDTYRTLQVGGIKMEEKRNTPVYFDLWGSPRDDGSPFLNPLRTLFPPRNSFSSPLEPDPAHADEGRGAVFISGCDSGLGMDLPGEGVEETEMELRMETERLERMESLEGEEEGFIEDEMLCGNRVSQMTRTYHDIEAVTRLLQEKEKDLELAAKIGQQLLARNKGLEEKNSSLEAELFSSSEKITQLKHDLLMKTDLLQIYTNDFDDSSAENTPTSLRHINVDLLQRRVTSLETENVYLREEASQLANDTQYCEEKEKELVNDVIKQLNEANLQVNQLSEELSKKIEDNLRHQEELTQLLAQVVELQALNKRITRENEELGGLVGVAKECQQELTTELAELKEKYAEVLDLLHDTQEQLRRVHKKNFPGSRASHLGGGGMFSSLHSGSDSIASELHFLSSGEEQTDKVDGIKSLNRVFDTVRLSSKLGSSMPPLGYTGGSVYSTPTKQASQTTSHLSTPLHMTGRYSPYFGGSGMSVGGSSGLPSLDSGAESDGSFPTDSEDNYPASRSGVPGWPGTPDLDSCLRRLGPQERNSLNYLPYGCRTPDSIMSTGSGKSGLSGYPSQDWKLPQKLQIVKPIEGSLTLHHWSRLATPHLGGLLEEKEGIAMKGATNSGLNLELYSMSDLEEEEEDCDEDDKNFPGKRFMSTTGIYTYTNSTVLHPDDVTNLTSSLGQTQMSALPTASIASSLPPTPSHGSSSQPPSRRGSTATFSTNVGIAKHLRERGFVDQCSASGMSITATPANSPSGSRSGSPEPSYYKLPGFEDLTKHFHAGASFLRRTIYGTNTPSYASSPTESPKINLVQRVQALGVERLVGSSELPQSVGGVVTSRPQPIPPLLHLSNLIRSSAKSAPSEITTGNTSVDSNRGSIMSTPKITSPGERRPQTPHGAPMGIPGHPGAGHLDSRLTQLKPGQRLDLGTVGNVGSRPRPSTLGTVPLGKKDEKMGTVGWTSLGRKGGLL